MLGLSLLMRQCNAMLVPLGISYPSTSCFAPNAGLERQHMAVCIKLL